MVQLRETMIMTDITVTCSFYKKCKNYSKECHHCKWNASMDIGDFLIMETKDGKTVRFL